MSRKWAPKQIDGKSALADTTGYREEIAMLRGELAKCAARVAELDRLANIDPLVDLFNRRKFLACLELAIGRLTGRGVSAAVLFLDIDGLKTINDRLGHEAGDQALLKVARLLAASVQHDDVVARFGGDEFAILLHRSDELCAWQTALHIVETVDECELEVNGVLLPLSVAVGVSIIRLGDTPTTVLERADGEMYRIKAISRPIISLGK